MKIGLIDFDGKVPNFALMKLSTYYKDQGVGIFLNEVPANVDKVYCSVLYTWNKSEAIKLQSMYENIEYGGTGWDHKKELPPEVKECEPDYDLYEIDDIYPNIRGIMKKETRLKKAETLQNMGLGYTSRGCVRDCEFCVVPKKEGKFRQTAEVKDLINPKSDVITLLDNNFTADPHMIEKCNEIKERNLTVDISQGIDVRLLTPKKAKALSEIKHLRSVHYAWDLMKHEKQVMKGIEILTNHIKKYKQMCFMLVGFNTTFEQDMYRFKKLVDLKVDPYVMIYNKKHDIRLKHFARWVNGRIYKKCDWQEYEPWVKAKKELTFNY